MPSEQPVSSFPWNASRSNAPELPALPQTPKEPNPAKTGPKPCDSCEVHDKFTWHCSYCDMMFCAPCWDKAGPHRPGRTGPDGLPHEKADVNVVERLKDILTLSSDVDELTNLRLEDEDTTWFGIDRDKNQKPVLQDYGRYATIIANSSKGDSQVRYPQLVSFIDQTGAGKCTLIKMLIDQQERQYPTSNCPSFASPIPGSQRTANVPTSGDVHLYGDPGTLFTQQPILYADCEVLEGGENMPVSTRLENHFHNHYKDKTRRRQESSVASHIPKRITKLKAKATSHVISWANSLENRQREYAVTQLYPRLLYTFSDTIVFVLRSRKTFESSVLSILLDWGAASIEKSLNQPTLPHVIIAINATKLEVDPKEWEPKLATASLMSSVSQAVNNNHKYWDRKEYWRGKAGKRIRSTQDLLECYYSSITVVRIPIKGRYMKIDEQIQKLHAIITERCAQSISSKRRSGMLSNSEELNVYLRSTFVHFATNLDTPFDFKDVAFRINPIPLDFGGNILKLAVKIRRSVDLDHARDIFRS